MSEKNGLIGSDSELRNGHVPHLGAVSIYVCFVLIDKIAVPSTI